MTEFLLSEVEQFAGANEKGPWVKYTLKDGNGEPVAATFSAELGNVAMARVGERIAITTKPASNPKYAPTLLMIEAAKNGDAPIETAHRPVIGGDKDRAIARMACLKAAAEIVAPRAATAAHPDYDAALETMKAADRFERWVYRDIDDVPFE
jgi:hypothetical protein